MIVPAIGALTAVLGVYITRPRPGENGLRTINRSFYISAAISGVLCVIAAFLYLPSTFGDLSGVSTQIARLGGSPELIASGAVILGIVLAGVILTLTGYFTGTEHRPVRDVGKTSLTGAATVILSGFALGLESAVYTALVIGGAVYAAFLLGGGSVIVSLFAIALAGCGLLTTVGVIVAMDTFGPVSDNAQGIAEMSGDVDAEGAKILTELDAVGNTTKAITKGIAISTAVLAATALFGSYNDAVSTRAVREAGIQLGGLDDRLPVGGLRAQRAGRHRSSVPRWCSCSPASRSARLAERPVPSSSRSAASSARSPGSWRVRDAPSTAGSSTSAPRTRWNELATPGLLAAMAPIAVGFGLGVGPLAGYLAGAIATGTLMAILLANSGGSWDNAKKLVEDGHHGGKGSDAHEATVIGDTVGDPFKDTAGPAINPLIKVMNLVSVLIAPAVVQLSVGPDANTPLRVGIAVARGARRRGRGHGLEAAPDRDQCRRGRQGSRRSRRLTTRARRGRERGDIPNRGADRGGAGDPTSTVDAGPVRPAGHGRRSASAPPAFGRLHRRGRARRLGPLAHAALHRNETTPGLRETADSYTAGHTHPALAAAGAGAARPGGHALPDLLDPLVAAGILHAYGDEVCALVDVRPYGATGQSPDQGRLGTIAQELAGDQDWWVVADLTPGMDGARPTVTARPRPRRQQRRDHACPADRTPAGGQGTRPRHRLRRPGPAPRQPRRPDRRHRRQPTGAWRWPGSPPRSTTCRSIGPAGVERTPGAERADPQDRQNPRDRQHRCWTCDAAACSSRSTARPFDLVVSNPPFVISPRGELAYRDSGLAGDEVCRRIVVEAPRHLAAGGVCQLLANWLHVRGEDWRDRLASWLRADRLRCLGRAAGGVRPGGVRRAVAAGRRPAWRPRLPGTLRRVARLVRGAERRGDRVRLDHAPPPR